MKGYIFNDNSAPQKVILVDKYGSFGKASYAMSIDLLYFFALEGSFIEVAAKLNISLGTTFRYNANDNEYEANYLGIWWYFIESDHHYSIEAQDQVKYPYCLKSETGGGSLARPIQIATMLCSIYTLHHTYMMKGELVFNTNFVLARFETWLNDSGHHMVYDTLHQTPFDHFGIHLELVSKYLHKPFN